MAKWKYKNVDTRTPAGLQEAERLREAGWDLIAKGFWTYQFAKQETPKKYLHSYTIEFTAESENPNRCGFDEFMAGILTQVNNREEMRFIWDEQAPDNIVPE